MMMMCVSGADIDALCVAPRHVERAEFFASFMERLQSEPGIRDLRVSVGVVFLSHCTGGLLEPAWMQILQSRSS